MENKLLGMFLLLFLSVELFGQAGNGSLNELSWILGTWERQNTKPGETHHEIWRKRSDQYFEGLGVIVAGSDTVFVEKLSIIIEEGNAYYIADVPENPEPVYFRFTSWEKNSFESENPEHDVPKKIAYNLNGDILTADVSWDDGGFEVVFKKVK